MAGSSVVIDEDVEVAYLLSDLLEYLVCAVVGGYVTPDQVAFR